ncbi:MAG: peptidyl-prolyl cis-trans isomerase D [Gammaproteobacteria bacterium]|jgi:peptidyl-prolyl cis-trans isomerase D
MLQSIREKTTGWIAYTIIFLISVPFALWGVNSYLGGGAEQPAATVDGDEISLRDLDLAYGNYRRQLAQAFGGRIPESFDNEVVLKGRVLEQLIEEYALRGYIDKSRYRIGDTSLKEVLLNMEVFQRDGSFDADLYRAQVESLGYSTYGFEQQLRQTSAMNQLQSGIASSAFATPSSIAHLQQLSSQSRSIRSLTLEVNLDNVEISDTELEDFYAKRQNEYKTEEQIKIEFIELSLESIKSNLVVEKSQIRDRYESSLDQLSTAEIRNARHILKSASADASESDIEALRVELNDIRQEILAGSSFSDLAAKYSDDTVSAQDGGDLGEIERGDMVQAFEDALYGLEVGDLSEPVKTSFGWHIIRLDAVSGGELPEYEQVRADLEDEIRNELAESQIYDLAENLSNLAYENPDSLAPAAEQLDLTVQRSEWFGRDSGTGIADHAKVRVQAFASDVLTRGLNSEAIEIDNSTVIFLRLSEHQKSEIQSLDDVKEVVLAAAKQDKVRQDILETGQSALASLNSGKSMESLAEELSIPLQDTGFIGRNDVKVGRDIVSRVFAMPKPDSGSIFDGMQSSNGSYTLIELKEIVSVVESVDIDLETLAKSVVQANASAEYQSVLKDLANSAEVLRTPEGELVY